MNIIDIHTHIFPDRIAKNHLGRMSTKYDVRLHGDGTISSLLQYMKENNVSVSATMPVATRPSQVRKINDFAYENRNDKIVRFASIHYDYEDIPGEIARVKSLGFRGVKLHPDYQDFYPNEKKMYKIYEECAKNDLMILFHTGDDIGYPAPGHALPRLFEGVISDFPTIKFIFAHLGGFNMWFQTFKYIIGKNVYIDTSFYYGYVPDDILYKILNEHDSDKILFGSDYPWGHMKNQIDGIHNLNISDEYKEKILYKNAKKLLGL